MYNVNFLSLPSIDINYENLINFKSESSRNTFFANKVKKTLQSNFKRDGNRTEISFNVGIDILNDFDYIYFTDKENKNYYYFITNIEIINENNCIVYLQLDVFTTYQFDFEFLDCFVERCHVNRWNGDIPTDNIIDEGLPLGEYVQEDVENLYTYNNGLLITSSAPLGKMDYVRDKGSGGGGGGIYGD
ncbi:MAG: hypothetical protein ACRCXT_00720 [Paraclostridium sp.]